MSIIVTTANGSRLEYPTGDSYENDDDTGVLDVIDGEGFYLATFNKNVWERIEFIDDEPTKAAAPRRWDSLGNVPIDVSVVDQDDDVWAFDQHGGWRFNGVKARFPLSEYDGPFTEVLSK